MSVAVAQSLREQVAWACRILALEGYADLTLGHVSARGADGEVWIKRKGVALDEVEPDDVVLADDTAADLHLETVLHTAVYRDRPDVGAVVHGHPPYATALGDNHNAYPGGQNVSSLHLDGVFLNATLQIVDDGTTIVKDGEWAL